MDALLVEIRACRACAEHLPLGPRPVVQTPGVFVRRPSSVADMLLPEL